MFRFAVYTNLIYGYQIDGMIPACSHARPFAKACQKHVHLIPVTAKRDNIKVG